MKGPQLAIVPLSLTALSLIHVMNASYISARKTHLLDDCRFVAELGKLRTVD